VALLAILAGILVALAILLLVMRQRGRRRRAAALAAARRVDPTDADALAAVPPQALDDLSRELVVEVDNALRTSANELDLAVTEFGEDRTQPFTQAVTKRLCPRHSRSGSNSTTRRPRRRRSAAPC
jgi:hypothetical protein